MNQSQNKKELDMTDKEKIKLLLEVLDDLLRDYWDLIEDAYDEENFTQYDNALDALTNIRLQQAIAKAKGEKQ